MFYISQIRSVTKIFLQISVNLIQHSYFMKEVTQND